MTDLAKRRSLTVFASVLAGSCLPRLARAGAVRDDHPRRWRGTAMGAEATIFFEGVDEKTADRLIGQITQEIDRLEGIFSLYRPESILSRLNAKGVVIGPEQEFTELLALAQHFAEITGGAFDPTVQPLWQALADLSVNKVRDEALIDRTVLRALDDVGYKNLIVSEGRVSFNRPGMQVTLNGIAQGYMTDRIANMLSENGFCNVLVDLGEHRATGPRISGDPWNVRIKSPVTGLPGREAINLFADALATSGGYGFRFDLPGQRSHLLDPRTGASPVIWDSLSVRAASATEADALSTAFSVMAPAEIATVLPLTRVSLVLGLPVANEKPVKMLQAG